MADLIQDLKDDHRLILQVLDEVKSIGVGTRAGQEKLLSAKAVLLCHMQKEDDRFYPVFKKAAEQNVDAQRTVQYFMDDMEVVSRKAMKVFDKHEHGAAHEEFAADVTMLYMTLKDRIRTEEDILFKKFEQLGLG